MNRIYLDYAAATPLGEDVKRAMEPYFSRQFYNPSASYLAARQVRQDLEVARQSLARNIGCRPGEIIFTSGATEANNFAIKAVSGAFPGAEILVSRIEHESVLSPAQAAGAKLIPVNPEGMVDTTWLANNITDHTVLVSIMLVNNETGSVQPLRAISQMMANVRHNRLKSKNKLPLYLHSDVAQAPNYLDVNVARLGVELMSINGGKIYGPKGIGALFIRAGVRVMPLLLGGGQEFGLRSGTENLPLIAGLASALSKTATLRNKETRRVNALRLHFEKELLKAWPQTKVNGGRHRAPHISNLTFPSVDNERLMMQLDEVGIECATGSACSAANTEPSHVLQALGLRRDDIFSSLRFSLGRGTKKTDIDLTVKTLVQLLRQQQ